MEIPVISDRNERMADPSYSDSRFNQGEHLVFDDGTGLGGGWEYDDRLASRDRETFNKAWPIAVQSRFTTSQPAFWDLYLSEFFGCKVLTHKIMAYVYASNGQPRWILKYSKLP